MRVIRTGSRPMEVREVASATVIPAGSFVQNDANKLLIEGTAAGTGVAFCPGGSAAGETTATVINDTETMFHGVSDVAFAETHRDITCDMVVNSGDQEVDLGASATDVFKVSGSNRDNKTGDTEVVFSINKTLD